MADLIVGEVLVGLVALGGATLLPRGSGFVRAAAAIFGLVGGLLGVAASLVDVLGQHIDGGGYSPAENAVYVCSLVLSVGAMMGGFLAAARTPLGSKLLVCSTAGRILIGLVAPELNVAFARWDLTVGSPLLVAAAVAAWRSDGPAHKPLQPTSGAGLGVE